MFGENQIHKQKEFINSDVISIKSIFYTIQGEGPLAGSPATFIRTGYCSLSCDFCDTEFEKDIKKMSVETILQKVKDITPETTSVIVITGGEPFLQPKLKDLVVELLDLNFIVQIETAGTLYIDLPYEDENLMVICSPKTGKLNSKLEEKIHSYKYVISSLNYDEEDGLPNYCPFKSNSLVKVARPKNLNADIYISPMDEYDKEQNLENMNLVTELCLKHGYVLSLQIHKIIGVD